MVVLCFPILSICHNFLFMTYTRHSSFLFQLFHSQDVLFHPHSAVRQLIDKVFHLSPDHKYNKTEKRLLVLSCISHIYFQRKFNRISEIPRHFNEFLIVLYSIEMQYKVRYMYRENIYLDI